MEILAPERYEELEEFVAHHPRGEFTQSPRWRLVKENWDYAAVVSRDADGKIKGSMGVLIQKIPTSSSGSTQRLSPPCFSASSCGLSQPRQTSPTATSSES